MMHHEIWQWLGVGMAGLCLAGCGGDEGGDTNPGAKNPDNAFDSAAQLCVDTINDYRESESLPPYERWLDQETCSNGEAESDSKSGQPHGAFGDCGEFAQNECPGWGGKPEEMITECLAGMWAEGPGDFNDGHGHYINMSSKDYTTVACGFFVTDSGAVWAVQNFK
jgi:hypothetical protein